jgi:glucose/arabinose dehydrogenase/sugar lactone lactonase YvrE
MKRLVLLALVLCPGVAWSAPKPEAIVKDLKNPESVAISNDGRIFVSIIGEFDKAGDGSIVEIKDGKAIPFCEKLNDPKGLVAYQQWLFVTDQTQVLRVDLKSGKSEIWADTKDFPVPPVFLNDIVADERGTLYVSDTRGPALFKIAPKPLPKGSKLTPERTTTLVGDGKTLDFLKKPNGLLMDSLNHLLVLDFETGDLNRLNLDTKKAEKVAGGFIGGDGLSFDYFGQLFITSWGQGKTWAIPRPGVEPILIGEGLTSAADLCYDAANHRILIPDMKGGTLTMLSTQIPGWEVDHSPLPLVAAPAFPNLKKWTGWDYGEDTGKVNPARPIVLTHANDGTGRTFVALQHGQIHIVPKADSSKSELFLDLQSKVLYKDNENEQGLLGLAFHPDYKKTGEFFVFYTDKAKKFENVVSRFRVSKTDPNKADPKSEEELLRVSHKFWNHDGGTLAFGPDGYLYIVLGDGGSGGDPDDNGQNLSNWLGKILRIDINAKGEKTPYAIPKDNPFIITKDAKPEIFCYGLRNPWRLSFDRKTGLGWMGDVGQNLWEEINLLEKGANYGWRRRESLHPFAANGHGPKKEMTDPIWEYHHDLGKSITGGHVYRGKAHPELDGYYLYADYVSSKIFALKYDPAKKRVVANRPLKQINQIVMSFGEDEAGEIYWMSYSPNGTGLFQPAKK